MQKRIVHTIGCLAFWSLGMFTLGPSLEASDLYWCSEQTGAARLQTEKASGCTSLDKPPEDSSPKKETALPSDAYDLPDDERSLSAREMQHPMESFLERYRSFLTCCADDPEAVDRIHQLEQQATALLKFQAERLAAGTIPLRSMQVWGLLAPVAEARDTLEALRQRHDDMKALTEKLESLDYETAARMRRKIEETKEKIRAEFHPPPRMESAQPTGDEIGSTPPTGERVGSPGLPGSTVGRQGRTGHEIGSTPRAGRDIGTTPRTGSEIGSSARTGPAIGR